MSGVPARLRRACLVVPAHAARMHAKALDAGADEIVFDLEDSVAPDAKAPARDRLLATLSSRDWAGRAVAVRVNGAASGEQDLDLALWKRLPFPRPAVVVPKAEDAGEVAAVAARAAAPVQALIETPAGLAAAVEIARADGVVALILGYADLAAALGRRGEADWLYCQETALAAARIAGVQAVDGPHFRLGDAPGLRAAARRTRTLGFDGKWAIHPEQVAALVAEFSSTARERDWASEVRAAVTASERSGGAVARVGGAMVDEAMRRRAYRVLDLPAAPAQEPALIAGGEVALPYYDDLLPGAVFDAPGLTITAGHAAVHQAIVGDRLRLALDADLYERVTGRAGLLAHPMLVCDVAIGQSTAPSARVLGNLFYRGLGCRPVEVGTTLRTRTEVVARRAASGGRGIVALRVTTEDAAGDPVIDFWRCPLLPVREGVVAVGGDDLSAVGTPVDARSLVPAWDLSPLRERALGPLLADLRVGVVIDVVAGETVSSAPELARLSLNVAMAHTDPRAGIGGRRLVYGGHVIGIAAAHVVRTLPDLATILTWTSCEHLGPTFEGDRLSTMVQVVALDPLEDGGLATVRARVRAASAEDDDERDVLDWILTALMP